MLRHLKLVQKTKTEGMNPDFVQLLWHSQNSYVTSWVDSPHSESSMCAPIAAPQLDGSRQIDFRIPRNAVRSTHNKCCTHVTNELQYSVVQALCRRCTSVSLLFRTELFYKLPVITYVRRPYSTSVVVTSSHLIQLIRLGTTQWSWYSTSLGTNQKASIPSNTCCTLR